MAADLTPLTAEEIAHYRSIYEPAGTEMVVVGAHLIVRLCAAAESAAEKDAENAALHLEVIGLREALGEQRQRAEKAEADAERDAKLLWGLVHNVKGKRGRLRWAVVRDACACGSTRAAELCRRFDTDPDAVWTGSKWRSDAASQPSTDAPTEPIAEGGKS